MSQENLEIVRRIVEDAVQGRWEESARQLGPDAEWHGTVGGLTEGSVWRRARAESGSSSSKRTPRRGRSADWRQRSSSTRVSGVSLHESPRRAAGWTWKPPTGVLDRDGRVVPSTATWIERRRRSRRAFGVGIACALREKQKCR